MPFWTVFSTQSYVKTVSIQDLKQHLSALIDEAAQGETILITKHQRPVATLGSARNHQVATGKHFGKRSLTRLLRNATKGRYLDMLAEDRREDR